MNTVNWLQIFEKYNTQETITGKEFMEIFCKEKGIPVPEPKAETMKKMKVFGCDGKA